MKKRLLALFLVLVLCMTMVLAGCKGNENPDDSTTPNGAEVTLEGSLDKTFAAMFGAESENDSVALLDRVLNKGKITIALADQLENTLYLDTPNKAFANTFSMSADGQSLNLGIYGKGQEIAIAAPELLGDTVYGINLSTLATDLKDSAIWSLMGTDYDTFMSEYGEQIEQILDMTKGMDENAINEMAEDLAADISKVLKDVETTTKEEEVEVYGKKVKAVVITYHMEKKDIEKLMDVMIDWMEEFMTGMMDSLEGIVDDSVDLEGAGSVDEMISQMRTEMETALEGIEIEGDFYAYINAKTQYVMQMGVEMTATIEDVTGVVDMAFILGEDPTNSDKYALVMEADANDEKHKMEISISVNEKADGDVKTTTYTLGMDVDGEKQEFTLSIAYNEKNSEYELTIDVEDAQLTAYGKLEITDNKMYFTIDEIAADGDIMPLGLSITIETGIDGMPEMPAYANILKMSEDELMALLGTLGQIAPEVPDFPDVEFNPNPGGIGNTETETVVGTGSFANGPITVYDANGIEIVFTTLEKDKWGDYRLSYEIINNTDGKVSVSTDNCAINGVTMNFFVYEEVAAGSSVSGKEILYAEELKTAGISTIYNIHCYDGCILDTENYDFEYHVAFELDCGDKDYVEKVDTSGKVVYDANGIKLISKGVVEDKYGDATVLFLLVNNREDHIVVDIDDICANGVETDKFGYGFAYAGTVSYVDSYWFESDLKDVGGKLKDMIFVMTIESTLLHSEIAEDVEVSVKF